MQTQRLHKISKDPSVLAKADPNWGKKHISQDELRKISKEYVDHLVEGYSSATDSLEINRMHLYRFAQLTLEYVNPHLRSLYNTKNQNYFLLLANMAPHD